MIKLNSNKTSFEESLLENIILRGKCVGCGACAIICPFNCLEYCGEKPYITNKCKDCGLCEEVCPPI